MIELIRNCSQGSEVSIYRVVEGSRTFVRKVATTPSGIAHLERESAGWIWYQERRYPSSQHPIATCRLGDHYGRFELDWFHGYKGNYRNGLIPNQKMIRLAVDHYCSLWPAEQPALVPLHGDFSIDNLIVNADGVHVLDWEHFVIDGGPWGLDPVYLLFESLWFGMKRRTRPRRAETRVIARVLSHLTDRGPLADQFTVQPLHTIRHFIQENKTIWGADLDHIKLKLPVLQFSDQQVADIDSRVRRELATPA